VRSSSEFSVLSDDINETVTALRGYIDAAEKRMEEELRLAAAIQDAALPKNFEFPRHEFKIYALMTPARQVGGDFYDFFFISDQQLALVIADVSGKGVPAALFMMRAKTAIKNFARSGNSPAKLLSKVNNTLCEGNDAEMFVTVWIGIIDLKTGSMQCANAGHEYPVLMRAGGSYDLVKDKHGLVLAAMEGIPMREYELQLQPGDRLFVYTDGVPEAINRQQEAYGTDRLVQKLNTLRDNSEQETLEAVLQDIRDFAGDEEQFDDITMIGFTYLGPDSGAG
jgi:serine phosphatase RsbU (regulator of sigma subunit)